MSERSLLRKSFFNLKMALFYFLPYILQQWQMLILNMVKVRISAHVQIIPLTQILTYTHFFFYSWLCLI